MTNPEYVRLSGPERVYGKKNFLQAELGLLSIMKRQKEYKRLRTEEIALKILLKKHVDEAQVALRILDAVMPKVPIHHPKEQNIAREELKELEAEERSIEQEIEQIRRRLQRMQ